MTSTPAPESFRFSRDSRLTRTSDLERVRREGKRVRTAQLELRVAASPLSCARAGIIVPKHGREIVERNRLKRRLRELLRTTVLPSLPPQDLVIRALPGAYALTWDQLAADVATLRRKLPHVSMPPVPADTSAPPPPS